MLRIPGLTILTLGSSRLLWNFWNSIMPSRCVGDTEQVMNDGNAAHAWCSLQEILYSIGANPLAHHTVPYIREESDCER